MIYFLRAQQDGKGVKAGWIKIGTTIQLSVRLRQISREIGHTPEVLGVTDGGYADEKVLHDRFDTHCAHREWFNPTPELDDFVTHECRPWKGEDEVVPALIAIKCRGNYKEWVNELAKHHRVTPSDVIDMALVRFAQVNGFDAPPER